MNSIEAEALLGLPGNGYTLKDVTTAYRSRSLEYHPDHGGEAESFLLIRQAREVLEAHLGRKENAAAAAAAAADRLKKTAENLREVGAKFHDLGEQMRTVRASDPRWEAAMDDLVDQMSGSSQRAKDYSKRRGLTSRIRNDMLEVTNPKTGARLMIALTAGQLQRIDNLVGD